MGIGGAVTEVYVSVPRSEPSGATAVTMRHGVPVSDALRNDRPSQVPAYLCAGPADVEARDPSLGAHAAKAMAVQSSVRMCRLRYVSRMEYERSDRATQGSEPSPVAVHARRVTQIRELDRRHVSRRYPADVARRNVVQALDEFVAGAIAAEVQLGARQEIGLPGRRGVLRQVFEPEGVDETGQSEVVELPALEFPDLLDHEREHLVRFGRADVCPPDRYGGLDVRRKGGVRESPLGPDRAVEPGRQ